MPARRHALTPVRCQVVNPCFFGKHFSSCVGPPLGAAFRVSTFDHAAAPAVRARSVILGRPSEAGASPGPTRSQGMLGCGLRAALRYTCCAAERIKRWVRRTKGEEITRKN